MARICDVCGKVHESYGGYYHEGGSFYCCEECFPEYMDGKYGAGNWKTEEEDGEVYYLFRNSDGEWEDTGLFMVAED